MKTRDFRKVASGAWHLALHTSHVEEGLAPMARFIGSLTRCPANDVNNISPYYKPEADTGVRPATIRDNQWHHVAWQYSCAEDLHELFLDGKMIWRMRNPDGRKLVNNRQHDAQFSIGSRLTGYARYGGSFNWLGWGNFFGQIGEIRISSIRRYD